MYLLVTYYGKSVLIAFLLIAILVISFVKNYCFLLFAFCKLRHAVCSFHILLSINCFFNDLTSIFNRASKHSNAQLYFYR